MEMVTLQTVAMTLGALVSIILLGKWGLPWLKRCAVAMFGNAEIHQKLDCLGESVDRLVSEVMVNDGSSLKDAVVRIESSVTLSSEIQHMRMLDHNDLVFRTDKHGNFVWVNRTFCRQTKRTPKELMGRGWINIIPTEHRARAAGVWYKACADKREFEHEIDWVDPDGIARKLDIKSYRMSGRHGETIGYLGTVTLN